MPLSDEYIATFECVICSHTIVGNDRAKTMTVNCPNCEKWRRYINQDD